MEHQTDRTRHDESRAADARERVDGLNLRAYELRGNDPVRARELAREAEELSIAAQYRRGTAHALRTLGMLAFYEGGYEEAVSLLDRAAPIFEELDEPAALASVANIRGHVRRVSGDGDGARRLFHQSLGLARRAADIAAESEALASIGTLYASKASYDRGLWYLHVALARLEEGGIRAGREAIILNIAITHTIRGELVEASGLLFDLISECRKSGERRVEARAQCQLARVYSEMGDFAAALGCFLEAVASAEATGNLVTQSDAYRGIGIIHKKIGDYPRALECAMKSLDLVRALGIRTGEASTLNNIGNIYYPMGELDKALDFFRQSSAIAEEVGMKDALATAIENIGNVMRDTRRFDEAAACFERSRALSEEIGDHMGVASCIFNVGRMQLDRMEYDAAIGSFENALETTLRLGLKPMAAQIHNDLASAYRARGTDGDLRLAFEHLAEYMRVNDEVLSRERQRAVTEMHMRMEMEKVEKEREIFRRETRKLQLDVEQKSQELNAMALRLVERNELLARLREEIGRASEQPGDATAGALARLRGELDATYRSEGEWNDFQENLRQVHRGFLIELSKRHPSLTPAELKVCALLRTQLSTKEIANLLAVTDRAVEKLRYRIRKKMGLPTSENLTLVLTAM